MDSLYDGSSNSLPDCRKFIRLAKGIDGLLPPWWSQEKERECDALGLGVGWSSLSAAVEKSDIIEHYGDPTMPMQLRMLGEQVYGSGPAGQPGTSMMRMQMMLESGEYGGASSLLDMSSSM